MDDLDCYSNRVQNREILLSARRIIKSRDTSHVSEPLDGSRSQHRMETERTMEFGNVLAGGALIGLLAGFWDKIKAVLWRVVNLVIQQVEIPSEPAHNAVVAYLVERYQRSRFYD